MKLAGQSFLSKQRQRQSFINIKKNYELYLFLLPLLVYFLIFHYGPMYGLQIAFKDFIASKGIWGSPWVGLYQFERLINSYQFWTILKNTLGLSFLNIVLSFPFPILLAISLNQVQRKTFKNIVQTATYAPHFISTVVLVGMLFVFLSPRSGVINHIIKIFGGDPIYFLGDPKWFKALYVLSDIWQHTGWSSILYLAALSGVSISLYEASRVDGATKLQCIWYIDIPSILPTITILLILTMGQVMSIGFEKTYLMQTPLNIDSSEIIATYVYKVGLLNAQLSFSTAVGLLNSLVNLILILTVNHIARKLGDTSLW